MYKFTIEYKAAFLNSAADFLSRLARDGSALDAHEDEGGWLAMDVMPDSQDSELDTILCYVFRYLETILEQDARARKSVRLSAKHFLV